MGLKHHPRLVTSGLTFYLDAANPRCYSGSGITVNNIVGGTGGTLDGTTFSSANSDIFTFDGVNDFINVHIPQVYLLVLLLLYVYGQNG